MHTNKMGLKKIDKHFVKVFTDKSLHVVLNINDRQ